MSPIENEGFGLLRGRHDRIIQDIVPLALYMVTYEAVI